MTLNCTCVVLGNTSCEILIHVCFFLYFKYTSPMQTYNCLSLQLLSSSFSASLFQNPIKLEIQDADSNDAKVND